MGPGLAVLLTVLAASQSDLKMGQVPVPSPTPVGWEFEFRFLDPERIDVQLPGQSEPETYWYIVYTVVNTSGRSQKFFPLFQIVTDDLRVYDTDIGIGTLVFDAIRERCKITHPYLVDPTKAIGPLLTGEDNARESVAIWRNVDLTRNGFKVYVAGLSGETQLVRNPSYDPKQPEVIEVTGPDGRVIEQTTNSKYFTLRKTLEIGYTLPGSPAALPNAVPERGATRWIMR